MQWSERQILDTLKLIENSDYDEVRIETAGFKLHVRKSGLPAVAPPIPVRPAPVAAPPSVDTSARTDVPVAAAPAHAQAPEPTPVPEGAIAIRAPMTGTFYRAPAPHLAPFVEVGAAVKADDTVCLIEVMKLFNSIKAGVAGKVVAIPVANAATVRHEQVLMIIEPS